MTTARRSISASSAWDRICSGVGYHLDNLGRWLIVNAPAIGSTYAAFLAPGLPRLKPRPGWMFAQEYYEQGRQKALTVIIRNDHGEKRHGRHLQRWVCSFRARVKIFGC